MTVGVLTGKLYVLNIYVFVYVHLFYNVCFVYFKIPEILSLLLTAEKLQKVLLME